MNNRLVGAAVAVIALAVAATALLLTQDETDTYVAPLQSYNITEDPQRIVVRASVWVGDELQVAATETPDRVTVTVRGKQRKDAFTFGEIRPVPVVLREALGSRTVVDGTTQRPLNSGGVYTPSPRP